MSENAPVGLGAILQASRRSDPADVPALAVAAAEGFGGTDVVVYLVDFGQQVLEPLRDSSSHEELSDSEPVATSVAGRSFVQRQTMTAERPDGTRVWVPVVEGTEVTGVLAVTVPEADLQTIGACEDLGLLVGYLIAVQARVTDVYNLHRRRKAMNLAASMQWDLLPPLAIQSRRVAAAGMLEPAYEVGGDCFDYALNGPHFELAIMDAMGHGVRSAVTAALAAGSYRHDRREGRSLLHAHRNLDEAIAAQFGGEAFVTGQLARIELDTGNLTWVNAGHPLPFLVRAGRVIGHLECPPALPWGLGPSDAEVATASLEPGDSVLFYTDGVVEARGPGTVGFGTDRLADLIGQHASDQLPVNVIVRLLIQAVREYHQNRLRDDATILLVQWTGSDPPELSGGSAAGVRQWSETAPRRPA